MKAKLVKFAKAVYSENEADKLNLPVDYDERLAISTNDNFALVIHNVQPIGHPSYKIKRLNLVRPNLSLV